MARQVAEGWFSRMQDGRVEVFLKAGDTKVRAHGSEENINEIVDWFEEKTGVTVDMPWRKRQGPKPIPGQEALALEEAFTLEEL